MHFHKIVIVCLILTCIVTLSCQKLEESTPTATLKMEKLKSLDAIPADYGKLVGVTMNPAYPNWAQLWFEKPDKTIVVVKVQWNNGYINEDVLLVPRR